MAAFADYWVNQNENALSFLKGDNQEFAAFVDYMVNQNENALSYLKSE
jgi:hypothetical protein